MSNKSRFKDVFATIKQGSEVEELPGVEQEALATAQPERRSTRVPGGKKNNPAYTQTTAYVKNEVYGEVRNRLIKQRSKQDYSELVEELLQQWLAEDNT